LLPSSARFLFNSLSAKVIKNKRKNEILKIVNNKDEKTECNIKGAKKNDGDISLTSFLT